tara:strand:- start:491 stop:1279 length:789 start_codon:yes stop_codon:yes gene_type:complete
MSEVIQRDWRGREFAGSDKPWLFTSGMKGATKFTVPLLEKGDKGKYTVRLGFTPLIGDKPGSRVFGVKLQGKSVLAKLDVTKAAGGYGKVVVREFKGIEVEENLLVELIALDFKGAAAIDIDRNLHHLGNDRVASWKESSPEPKGFVLKIPFQFGGKDEAYTMSLLQRDVHNGWDILLNGRAVGQLKRNTKDQVARLAIPRGVLRKGANELIIRADAKNKEDDIEVGRIQLTAGDIAPTLIHSLEVIREDGPRKVAAKPQSR